MPRVTSAVAEAPIAARMSQIEVPESAVAVATIAEAYGRSRRYAGAMPERPRRPDLDESFSLPEDTDPDEVLTRLLETEDGSEAVSDEPEDEADG